MISSLFMKIPGYILYAICLLAITSQANVITDPYSQGSIPDTEFTNMDQSSIFDLKRLKLSLHAIKAGDSQTQQHYLNAIDQYIENENWDTAQNLIHEGLALSPESPQLLIRAAHVELKKKNYFLAESYWEKLALMFPDNAWIQACWGGLLFRIHHFSDAETALQKALVLNPDELVARYNLTCTRIATGHDDPYEYLYTLTSEDIGKLCTWIPDDSDILLATFDNEQSFRHLCQSVLTTPSNNTQTTTSHPMENDDIELLNKRLHNIARSLYDYVEGKNSKDWQHALNALKTAKRLGAQSPAIYTDIAICGYHLGDKEKAFLIIERLNTMYPDNALIKDAHKQLSAPPLTAEKP